VSGKLIPFGYMAKGSEECLNALMKQPNAYLIDIRLMPMSRWRPQWNQYFLQEKWANRYLHLRCLGNENYKSNKEIKLSDPERGIPCLIDGLQLGYTLILLCACSRYEHCHRRTVVEMVQAAMPDVEIVGVQQELF
jgi:hypothetical protein